MDTRESFPLSAFHNSGGEAAGRGGRTWRDVGHTIAAWHGSGRRGIGVCGMCIVCMCVSLSLSLALSLALSVVACLYMCVGVVVFVRCVRVWWVGEASSDERC